MGGAAERTVTCRLPPRALSDSVFRLEVRGAIAAFFQTMRAGWEAFKVYMRGICLAWQLGILLDLRQRLLTLEGQN